MEEIKQEIKQEEKKENVVEKRNSERILKIFSIILAVISVIALIWIKMVNPKFPLLFVILIGGFILLVSVIMFFGFAIYRKFQEKPDASKEYNGKLPKPASLGTLRKLAEDCLTNEYFCNHTSGCKSEKYTHSGKYNERIYLYHTTALYNSDMEKGEVFIIINAHFPEDLKAILIDPGSTELTKAIFSLASNKEELPDEETESRKTFNPITNAYEEIEKRHTKKDIEKKKEEKEDLK